MIHKRLMLRHIIGIKFQCFGSASSSCDYADPFFVMYAGEIGVCKVQCFGLHGLMALLEIILFSIFHR